LAFAAAAREPGLVLRDAEQVVADLYGAVTTPHFFATAGRLMTHRSVNANRRSTTSKML